jgi:hypothetical protein
MPIFTDTANWGDRSRLFIKMLHRVVWQILTVISGELTDSIISVIKLFIFYLTTLSVA